MAVRKADKEGATVVERMRYISVFSGIEACSVAWESLGWEPVAFADFEKFPSAVLAHHYPEVPNLGDVTKVNWNEYRGKADVVVGGSPCQGFSVAGKRLGLDDPRSNLALHYARIVRAVEPTWFLYENVPGLLSSDEGRDMGALIATLGNIGYGLAWRVLDAQFFGVAQRRRRVFIVGHASGDWRRAAAVLFEPEGLSRNPPPRPSKGQDPASLAQDGPGSDGLGRGRVNDPIAFNSKWSSASGARFDGVVSPTLDAVKSDGISVTQAYVGGDVAHTLHKSYHDKLTDQDAKNGVFVVEGEAHTWSAPAIGYLKDDDLAGTITANSGEPGETQTPALVGQSVFVHHSQDSRMVEAEEVAGTLNTNDSGRFGHAVVEPIPIQDASDSQKEQNGVGVGQEGDASFTLFGRNTHGVAQPVPFVEARRAQSSEDHETWEDREVAPTMNTFENNGDARATVAVIESVGFNCMQDTTEHIEMVPTISTGNQQGISNNAVATGLIVRRLTPLECERLQGFPDGYTMIPWKGKPPENCPDGPRYRALGNSMAVPVMRWIGEGIDMVHRIPVADQAKSGVQEWL